MTENSLAIDLRGVSVRKGDAWPLRQVTWSVPNGQAAAILGPNGSGKSSLLRVITGYWYPTEGEVAILGRHFGRCDMHELRQHVRLVAPPGPFDFDPRQTVREIALTGFRGTLLSYDEPPAAGSPQDLAACEAVARVGMSAQLHQAYGTLSTGERMRCQIARSLVTEPPLLLLDEPTAGLDIPSREALLETIDHLATHLTLVMVTHHPEELPRNTSSVLLMEQGTVAAAGRPEEVLTDAALSKAYGVPLHVTHEDGRCWVRVRRRS